MKLFVFHYTKGCRFLRWAFLLLFSFLVELAGEPFVRGLAHLVGTYKMCNIEKNEQFGPARISSLLTQNSTYTLIRLMKILLQDSHFRSIPR